MLTRPTPAYVAPRRIALIGRLTPAQVAAHNAFIDAMRDDTTQGIVSQQSRFVGVVRGLIDSTTI